VGQLAAEHLLSRGFTRSARLAVSACSMPSITISASRSKSTPWPCAPSSIG
jgi:hypothetical protein